MRRNEIGKSYGRFVCEYLPPVCWLYFCPFFFVFCFKVRAWDCLLRIHSLPTEWRGWGHVLCEWQRQWCHLTWRRWWREAKSNEWEKCLWTEVLKLNSISGDGKCFRLWEIVLSLRGLNHDGEAFREFRFWLSGMSFRAIALWFAWNVGRNVGLLAK